MMKSAALMPGSADCVAGVPHARAISPMRPSPAAQVKGPPERASLRVRLLLFAAALLRQAGRAEIAPLLPDTAGNILAGSALIGPATGLVAL